MKSGKKALFIATVGGFVSKFELNNVSLLQGMGYKVHSAANFREPVYSIKERELSDMDVTLHQLDIEKSPYMWRQNWKALKQLCGIIRTEGISLIHCHTPVGGVLGRLAALLCQKQNPTVIYTAHGFHFYKGASLVNWLLYYSVERLLARHTDILITINEEDYILAKGFRLRKGGCIYKIPGEGLHMEEFPAVSESQKKELRQHLGVEENVFFLLSVGELSGNKNHQEIIRLMPDIKRRLEDRKILYGICGDGFYREELESLVEGMGLLESVKLYGYQENIFDYLACADCLVFPSVREGLGMVALEAMSMGIPVVASDNRGTREYMKDGCNGYVCDVKKAVTFIDAIEKVCRMQPQELAAMGEEGRKTAKRFDIRKTNDIMGKIYETADALKEPLSEVEARIHYISSQENSMRKAQ